MTSSPSAILSILVALALNCRADTDGRILGSWQSDQKATLDYLSAEAKTPQKILDILTPVLGKLIVTYTPKKAVFENCELEGTYDYRILESSKDYIRLQIIGANGEKGSISTLYFSGSDRMWSITEQPKIPGFREFFLRVPEKK